MDTSIIVVMVLGVAAFALLVWLEVHSRRSKRSEVGRGSPGGPADAADDIVEGG